MPFVDPNPGSELGTSVPDGECVAYVKKAADAPATSLWKPGTLVKGNRVKRGTAIATFGPNGKYQNVSGLSHAAIYDGQDDIGLKVWDQWTDQVVHENTLRFGAPIKSRDGNQFHVIERRTVSERFWQTLTGWIRT